MKLNFKLSALILLLGAGNVQARYVVGLPVVAATAGTVYLYKKGKLDSAIEKSKQAFNKISKETKKAYVFAMTKAKKSGNDALTWAKENKKEISITALRIVLVAGVYLLINKFSYKAGYYDGRKYQRLDLALTSDWENYDSLRKDSLFNCIRALQEVYRDTGNYPDPKVFFPKNK